MLFQIHAVALSLVDAEIVAKIVIDVAFEYCSIPLLFYQIEGVAVCQTAFYPYKHGSIVGPYDYMALDYLTSVPNHTVTFHMAHDVDH